MVAPQLFTKDIGTGTLMEAVLYRTYICFVSNKSDELAGKALELNRRQDIKLVVAVLKRMNSDNIATKNKKGIKKHTYKHSLRSKSMRFSKKGGFWYWFGVSLLII